MKDNNLIALSFVYYDMQKKKFKKFYNKKYTIKFSYENNISSYELNDNTKTLIKGEFNLIGRFFKDTNIFRWGWDFIFLDNNRKFFSNNTYYIKKIINYIFSLNIDANNVEELIFYNDIKNMFLHHKVTIDKPLQLEQILAITLYITKSEMIYKVELNDQNITEYYLLRNIQIL